MSELPLIVDANREPMGRGLDDKKCGVQTVQHLSGCCDHRAAALSSRRDVSVLTLLLSTPVKASSYRVLSFMRAFTRSRANNCLAYATITLSERSRYHARSER
jgi:hypothetical protein